MYLNFKYQTKISIVLIKKLSAFNELICNSFTAYSPHGKSYRKIRENQANKKSYQIEFKKKDNVSGNEAGSFENKKE